MVAVASRPEAAALAAAGVEHLAQALSQQGLMLTQFTVHLDHNPGHQALAVQPGARTSGRREESLEEKKLSGKKPLTRVDCFI